MMMTMSSSTWPVSNIKGKQFHELNLIINSNFDTFFYLLRAVALALKQFSLLLHVINRTLETVEKINRGVTQVGTMTFVSPCMSYYACSFAGPYN